MLQSKWRRAMPGAALAVVAALAFYNLHGLSYGTAGRVGPALVPAILAGLLFILGLVVAIERLWECPIGGDE